MTIKALLVEDDQKYRLLFKRILERRLELKVFEATNGKEGFELLQKEKPVIAFLDVEMPEMSGLELLESIRQNKETNDLIVVIMTATDDKSIVKRILELGVADYILKNDSLDSLVSRLNSIIAKYKNLLTERSTKKP